MLYIHSFLASLPGLTSIPCPLTSYNNLYSMTNNCSMCVNLDQELVNLKAELKSAWEIIRTLQENVKINTGVAMPRPNMAAAWTSVQKGRHSSRSMSNTVYESVPISNRFDPLKKIPEESEKNKSTRTLVTIKCKPLESETKKKPVIKQITHKILVIGDSHARDCAAELTTNFQKKDTVVCGVVKPGMCLEVITDSMKNEMEKMTKKDVVVWGGTNDIGKDNTNEGQRHLQTFVERNKHTNIIVMTAPHRHDLSRQSCVNNEVIVFNRKLKKRMKIHENVHVLELEFEREYFTRHGLHMNRKGKEKAARIISANIHSIFNKSRDCIELKWEAESKTEKKEEIVHQQEYITTKRSSARSTKTPGHLQDFLCPSSLRRRPRHLTG
jgi:hypothetical protein